MSICLYNCISHNAASIEMELATPHSQHLAWCLNQPELAQQIAANVVQLMSQRILPKSENSSFSDQQNNITVT